MKIGLTTENTADLDARLIEELNLDLKVIPFTLVLGEKEVNGGEITTQEIFDFVSQTKVLPKTTAINQFEYEEFFEKVLQDYDYIIHISLSSEISSTCSHAKAAAEEKFKDKVFVIDSRSLSTGIALSVVYADKLIKQGLEVKEIVSKVEERVKHVQASFILERLDYLFKGGRCNMLQLLGANLMKFRPQILVKDGSMVVGKKYRGPMARCVKDYTSDILNEFNNADKDLVFLTYTSATPEMVEAARTLLTDAGFKHIYEVTAGTTIACHCGEHTIGVLYVNDAKE